MRASRSTPLQPPSDAQKRNFFHLYFDIAWFGILFGSTASFLPVFITRLGAESWHLGVLNAAPALLSAVITIYAGQWIQKRTLTRAVRWTLVLYRIGFLIIAPLPLMGISPNLQIWIALGVIILIAIPGAILSVGFDALLATAVPPEWRAIVVGRRNAFLAIATMISFLASGWLLDTFSFEQGYLMVFAIGAIGAGMSTFHVLKVHIDEERQFQYRPMGDRGTVGNNIGAPSMVQRLGMSKRMFLRWRPVNPFKGLTPRYRQILGAYFLFHFAQMLPAPLFPIFWVREMQLSDGEIGWINVLFYLAMFFASFTLGNLTARFGNHKLAAFGAILLASYPLFTGLSYTMTIIVVTNILGGIIWGILRGGLYNRLLEVIPDGERPQYLAAYYFIMNGSLFLGTMSSPFLADFIGVREALFIIAALRVISGIVMLRFG